MNRYDKEITPVIYSPAAIKTIKALTVKEGDECFRMHWHERMEILRIREGNISVNYGISEINADGGSAVIIHPHQPHRGTAGLGGVVYDTLMFDLRTFYNGTGICGEYLPPVFDGRTKFSSVIDDSETVDCIDRILSENHENSMNVMADIYRLFYLLYRTALLEFQEESPFDKNMKEIIAYIRENYASELSTDILSREFRYAKPYFCRRFKEVTGLTPTNYIRIYRIEKACEMLRRGSRNVGEVSRSCGFTDQNYFTRCFKAHFGNPPSYYINHQGEP